MFREPMDTWTARLQRSDFCKMSDDKWEKVMRYLDHYVDDGAFGCEEVGVRWRGFGQSDGDDNEEEEEENEKATQDYDHDDEKTGRERGSQAQEKKQESISNKEARWNKE